MRMVFWPLISRPSALRRQPASIGQADRDSAPGRGRRCRRRDRNRSWLGVGVAATGSVSTGSASISGPTQRGLSVSVAAVGLSRSATSRDSPGILPLTVGTMCAFLKRGARWRLDQRLRARRVVRRLASADEQPADSGGGTAAGGVWGPRHHRRGSVSWPDRSECGSARKVAALTWCDVHQVLRNAEK